MKEPAEKTRERYALVATNPMRIAGLQGVYGDPCGIELVPVSLSEALRLTLDQTQRCAIFIDAGSISPLFEVLFEIPTKLPASTDHRDRHGCR